MEGDPDRYFPNPFADNKDDKLKIELPAELREKLLDTLERNIVQVTAAYLHLKDHTVYTGSSGVAFLHFHLATTLYAQNDAKRTAHLRESLQILTPTLTHPRRKPKDCSFLLGVAGPLALGAVVNHHLENAAESRQCANELKGLYLEHKSVFLRLPSELLYGHVGYLYSLLFVKCHIPSAVDDALLTELVTMVLDVGESGRVPSLPSPLMYSWYEEHYLGAAHGLAGIFTVLLQALPAVPSLRTRVLSLVKPSIDHLLSLALPSGNFPASLESVHNDTLVHWCHGAPGCVHLFGHAFQVFGDQRYLQAAVRCGEVVWRRGLLRKGYGLCHGVAGNAYTFLQLLRVTGKPEYFHRALKFTEWCLSSSERTTRTPDNPYSLFEGLAGTLAFFADMLHNPLDARFPALELPVCPQS
ncbi:hypothetical protein EMCRGX_G012763 [Ephydatia muelleri]